jgi:hypothetical protein
MNDSVEGYTRTGTLNMCFVMENQNPNSDSTLGLKLQVIGNFHCVIRQYMERSKATHPVVDQEVMEGTPDDAPPAQLLQYQLAYMFGQSLRNQLSKQNCF